MKVKDSPLYKTLCEAVRKEDHAELLRMLEMVQPDSSYDGLQSGRLLDAFSWRTSPQGLDYWLELSRRLAAAGWGCW